MDHIQKLHIHPELHAFHEKINLLNRRIGHEHQLLPIALLAPIGMVMGICSALGQSCMIEKFPILFAMGVAQGMAKKEKGIAVFASVVGYLTLNTVMNVFLKNTGTLAFAFFGRKKSIPIITFVCMIPIGLVLPIVWNLLISFLISISFIFTTNYIGSGIYYMLHRALIPFGLHHVLAAVVRFTEAGGTYLINGTEYVGILPAVNEILFNLGPDSPYWAELMPKLTSYLGDSSAYMLYDGMLEEALELTTEVLMRAEELTATLHVNKERMYQNALLNKGLDNSECVMMKIAKKLGKDRAHELLYDKAMLAELDGKDYLTVLKEDPVLSDNFTDQELEEMIKPENYTGLSAFLARRMAKEAKEHAKKEKENQKNGIIQP